MDRAGKTLCQSSLDHDLSFDAFTATELHFGTLGLSDLHSDNVALYRGEWRVIDLGSVTAEHLDGNPALHGRTMPGTRSQDHRSPPMAALR